MSAEKETALAGAAVEAAEGQALTANGAAASALRQAAVLIILEPGRAARVIPVCDNDSQEPDLAELLTRARRMVEADDEGQRQ